MTGVRGRGAEQARLLNANVLDVFCLDPGAQMQDGDEGNKEGLAGKGAVFRSIMR